MKDTILKLKLRLATLCLAAITLGIVSARAQGVVDFRNTGATLITTNDFQGHTGLINGQGNYLFGLYVGPFGSNESLLLLAGVATNSSVAGLLGPKNLVISGLPIGSQVSFQVRGWSSFGGNSYEQATAYASGGNLPLAYLGASTLGYFTVPSSGTVTIFGNGPGQVGGFELAPIPEPSASVLGGVGVVMFYTLARKRGLYGSAGRLTSRLPHHLASGSALGGSG
jgi:hypothetical protein